MWLIKSIISISRKYVGIKFLYYLLFKRLNLIKSIYVNLRVYKYRFYRFPILIFGRCEVSIKGKIEMENTSFAIVKLGYRGMNIQSKKNEYSQLIINGLLKITPNDVLIFVPGYKIHVMNKAVLHLSDGYFGTNTLIQAHHYIKIGYSISSSWNCEYMDSDGHYIYDICSRQVKKCTGKIIIGNNCWIANGVSIAKNTILSNNTIVGCKSLINKDFSASENVIISGVPGTVKRMGCRRIFKDEYLIKSYFEENSSDYYYEEYIKK